MTLLTWVKDTQENWKELLSQRVAQIIASVQNWGVCDATNLIGDPLLGVISTTPALFSKSPAPSCVAPLEDAVSMLPITRPVAVWKKAVYCYALQMVKFSLILQVRKCNRPG